MKPTILVVDIRHWLDDAGQLPEGPVRLRQQALRIARLIEYAATLRPKTMGETPVECSRRPGRKRCMGLLWVEKRAQMDFMLSTVMSTQRSGTPSRFRS